MDNFLSASGLCMAVVEIAGLGHHVDEFTHSAEKIVIIMKVNL